MAVKKPVKKPIKKKPIPKEKKPTGAPTKYNPKWVTMLASMFEEGQSVLEVAVKLGVCRDSLYEYASKYPEFSDALTRGRQISQAWWELQGRKNLFDVNEYDAETKLSRSQKFNDRLWYRNVACRFKDDWSEKSADVPLSDNHLTIDFTE